MKRNIIMNKMPHKLRRLNQSGLASIVIVGVLVVLIALVSVGFSRLMNRNLNQSVQDQKSSAAYYAAESAVNDVVKQLKQNATATIAKSSSSSCNNALLTTVNN